MSKKQSESETERKPQPIQVKYLRCEVGKNVDFPDKNNTMSLQNNWDSNEPKRWRIELLPWIRMFRVTMKKQNETRTAYFPETWFQWEAMEQVIVSDDE